MQIDTLIKITLIFLGLLHSSAYSKNLNEVISSLYEGDGVQLVDPGGAHSHAAHFEDSALQQLNKLATSAAQINYPYPNASSGSLFHFDPILDNFIESTNQHGVLYTQQAKTLGKGAISFGLLYSQAEYDQANGQGLDSISLELGHLDVGGPGSDICLGGPTPNCYLFEDDRVILEVDLSIKSKQFFIYGAIGLSDSFDLEVILPIIENTVSISSRAAIFENETKIYFTPTLHRFAPEINGDAALSQASATKIGLGDVKINGKWQVLSSEKLNLASFIELTLPTGEYDNFMGQDTYSLKGSLLGSSALELAGSPIKTHLNIGYEISHGLGHNKLSYALGVEYDLPGEGPSMAAAVEVLGSHNIETRSGFGDDQVDAAIGIVWPFLENQSISLNYRFPINDNGLRASHILSAGYALSL